MSQVGVDHKTHCRLSWFSTFQNSYRTGRRDIEQAEIELISTTSPEGKEQKLIVDGKCDDVSEWIYDESLGLLILKMHTIFAPAQVRYYAFENIAKTKNGDMCWLCQHSCKDRRHEGQNIMTYANKFVFDVNSLRAQTYHIELTEHE